MTSGYVRPAKLMHYIWVTSLVYEIKSQRQKNLPHRIPCDYMQKHKISSIMLCSGKIHV